MYEAFLEIAFEADLDTSENSELLVAAKELCNENPLTRDSKIVELRQMIFDRSECRPLRTDDQYLLKFLRCRDFIVPRAHKLMVRYCSLREQYPSLWDGVDLWGLTRMKNAYEGVFYDRPDVGRISVFRFGYWDPIEFSVEDLVRAGLAQVEIGTRCSKHQVLGGTVIVDMEGLSLRQVSTLTPTVAYQIVSVMGVAFPSKVRGIHIINYSWILNTFFYLFKRFIPQAAWSNIYFHGHDLKSLQQYIAKECLPIRYGGTCRNTVPAGTWLKKIKKYRDETFDRDMKLLGYVIKE